MSSNFQKPFPGGNFVLSVVIPVYNEEACIDTLLERIEAIVANLPKPFEVVCVNDGSRDKNLGAFA